MNLVLIESNKNNWILGFNLALKSKFWPKNSLYYIFSDADILVPPIDHHGCWLRQMVDIMDNNVCIGKLGMSLKVDDIDFWNKEVIVAQRKRFESNSKISGNYVAPVDTTLAIYRNDFFIGKEFKFSIGHASLAKPFYYTCRTNSRLEAKHLGWYDKHRMKQENSAFSEKIRCFARLGCFVDKETLRNSELFDRMFYRIVRPSMYLFFGVVVITKIFFYLLSNFPRKINIIQFNSKGNLFNVLNFLISI
ncbi:MULTISPECIES: hypothetical protein [Comamonas]|uniref:hypothetical protein n=1 Tax=Comamonas TaxID=283 RepID=UPI00237EDBD6|nr:hypothetical protein [Comamonas aquatica]MDE1554885.1 hypothetical protein [Comamonas aquatica]